MIPRWTCAAECRTRGTARTATMAVPLHGTNSGRREVFRFPETTGDFPEKSLTQDLLAGTACYPSRLVALWSFFILKMGHFHYLRAGLGAASRAGLIFVHSPPLSSDFLILPLQALLLYASAPDERTQPATDRMIANSVNL